MEVSRAAENGVGNAIVHGAAYQALRSLPQTRGWGDSHKGPKDACTLRLEPVIVLHCMAKRTPQV